MKALGIALTLSLLSLGCFIEGTHMTGWLEPVMFIIGIICANIAGSELSKYRGP